jgi:hypothetical protein
MKDNYWYFKQKGLWVVFEIPTGQIIKSFADQKKAERYCGFLRNGGAFNGHTPAFMLIPLPRITESL